MLFNSESTMTRKEKQKLIDNLGPVDLGGGYNLALPEMVAKALRVSAK